MPITANMPPPRSPIGIPARHLVEPLAEIADVAASFQEAVADVLVAKARAADPDNQDLIELAGKAKVRVEEPLDVMGNPVLGGMSWIKGF